MFLQRMLQFICRGIMLWLTSIGDGLRPQVLTCCISPACACRVALTRGCARKPPALSATETARKSLASGPAGKAALLFCAVQR